MKGFTKIDNKVLFAKDLQPFSKLVLASLTYYTRNGEGSCFARKTTLSRMIGISLYHLRKSLKELEEKQFIKIIRRGQGNPDTIYLNDFQSTYENPSHLLTIIGKEEKKIEEEEFIPTKEEFIPIEDEKEELPISNTDNVDEVTPQIATTHQKQANPNVQSTTAPPDHHQHQQHQQATETITNDFRDYIEPFIGINSYKHFFSNISVVNETDDTISLYSPHGEIIANLIKEKYSTKLANILGKDVKIITS